MPTPGQKVVPEWDEEARSLVREAAKKGVPARLTGGYFGVRNAEFFTEDFLKYVKECKSFTDLTAGTGQFPYSLAKSGFPTYVNDRCLYASIILRSVFNHRYQRDLKDWYPNLSPEYVALVKGYLTNNFAVGTTGRIFSEETANYLDGVCKLNAENLPLLYAVGKVMLRWTYRGLMLTPTMAKGERGEDITPHDVLPWLMRELYLIQGYSRRIPKETPRAALYGDAKVAVETHPIKDGFVYIDPAWPWIPNMGKGNPYVFFTDTISSVLAQEKVTIPPWATADSPDKILTEVASWMDIAFKRGAKYFCVCTQDTNYPPGPVVYDWMWKRFNEVDLIEINDWSSAANRNYINWWGIYSGRRGK